MSEKRPIHLVENEEEFAYVIEETVIHWLRRADGRLKTLQEAITLDKEQCRGRKDAVGMLLFMEVEDLIEDLACLRIKSQENLKPGMES